MQTLARTILTVAILAVGLSAPLEAQHQDLEDEAVRLAIEGELWEAKAVDANTVDIEVERGIVRLSGTVENLISRERIVRIAQMTRGVVSVVDELAVSASGRSDAAIRQDVLHALSTDPATDSWEIGVTTDDGVVTLTGSVESYAESELAERVAKAVYGVRDLDNRLSVTHQTDRPDAEIRAEIEQMLEWDVRLDDGLMSVEVDNGNVTLHGSVGSEYERQLAMRTARVAGVDSVDGSDLEVQWWMREQMQRPTAWADLSDGEVAAAVQRAIAHDTRVDGFVVSVAANEGTVTLTGVVDNLKAKRAAGQDAQNTMGVWRVRNYIKVRPVVARADDELSDDIRDAVARDPIVNGTDITVLVEDGQAYLYGSVDSQYERDHAEDVAVRVNGVVDVHNYLRVAYEGRQYSYRYHDWDPLLYDYDFDRVSVHRRADAEIAAEIESELSWSPFVDADTVEVTVEDGIATLAGSVDNLHERRLATQNALEGGAVRVVNRLDIVNN